MQVPSHPFAGRRSFISVNLSCLKMTNNQIILNLRLKYSVVSSWLGLLIYSSLLWLLVPWPGKNHWGKCCLIKYSISIYLRLPFLLQLNTIFLGNNRLSNRQVRNVLSHQQTNKLSSPYVLYYLFDVFLLNISINIYNLITSCHTWYCFSTTESADCSKKKYIHLLILLPLPGFNNFAN